MYYILQVSRVQNMKMDFQVLKRYFKKYSWCSLYSLYNSQDNLGNKLLLISNNLGNNEAIFHSYSLYSLYNSLFPVMKVIMYYIACIVCKACTVRKKGQYYIIIIIIKPVLVKLQNQKYIKFMFYRLIQSKTKNPLLGNIT